MNFENFYSDHNNQYAVKVARDFTNKNKAKMQANGLIIMGKSGVGKTHLAGAIANRLRNKKNRIYKKNYVGRNIQNLNFEHFYSH